MLGGTEHVITPVKLAIGFLLIMFAWLELLPKAQITIMPERYLPIGGLSGHQGALRSMFLLKAGLTKEAFIATGIVIALLIDMTRLSIYLTELQAFNWRDNALLVGLATISAFWQRWPISTVHLAYRH